MTNGQRVGLLLASASALASAPTSAHAVPSWCHDVGFMACVSSTYCEFPVAWHCRTIALAYCGSAAQSYSLASYCDSGCFPDERIVCIAGDD